MKLSKYLSKLLKNSKRGVNSGKEPSEPRIRRESLGAVRSRWEPSEPYSGRRSPSGVVGNRLEPTAPSILLSDRDCILFDL